MRGRAGASPEWTLLQVCVYLDGSNVENKISLLVILCIIMYVYKKKKKKIKTDIIFLQNRLWKNA